MKHSTFISLTAGIAVAACSLLAPTGASASIVEKHIKWGRHHTSVFDSPRMQQIQAANAVLNGTKKPVGGLKRLAPAGGMVTNETQPAEEFKDLDYLGDLDGPDGQLWYYTAHYDYETVLHEYYTEFMMRGYSFDIYDAEMKLVGTVKDSIVYGEDETRVPLADLAPVVTRHFFNTDDKYEIMVGVVFNTKNYVNREYTKVYSINGEKDEKGNDVCIKTIRESVADVLDVSTAEKEDVYISFVSDGTDFHPTKEDSTAADFEWQQRLGYYTELKTYASAVDANGPRLVNTYRVKLQQLPGDQQNTPIILSYVRNGQPYFVTQYYEQPFYNPYNTIEDDLTQREGNNLIIDIYKVADTGFEKVQTSKIPVVKNTADEEVIASYFSIGMLGYYGDVIENGGAARDFVINRQDYISSSDDLVNNFYRYSSQGELTNTICEEANSFVGLSALAGHDPQIMFVGADEYGFPMFNFVNMNTYKTELSIPQSMDMGEDADEEKLTANMDRVAVGDSYMYATELRSPGSDEDNNTFMRILWINRNGEPDHIDEVNMGQNVNYATTYMSAATLNPHFFNSDDNYEYMMLIKRAQAGGGSQEELLIGQVTDEEGEVNDLLLIGPDSVAGVLATIVPYDDRLMVSFKKSVDSRDLITVRYYLLPLDKEDGISNVAGDAEQNGFKLVGDAIVADGRIELFDMTGARVAAQTNSLSLQDVRAGIYVVRANGRAAKVVVR